MVLLFLFPNVLIPIPMSYIDVIQKLLNKFLWQGRKPRIKTALLCKRHKEGGIAFLFIRRYYYASRLTAMQIWWAAKDQPICDIEQSVTQIPLTEWVMVDPKKRVLGPGVKSIVYQRLMEVRRRWQFVLSSIQ